ncbi:MAG: hypothetical protein ACQGVC_24650 [Myxococcota bacterium]
MPAPRLVVSLLLALAAAPAPAAVHLLSGNARFQQGAGLPVPVTVAPIPTGAVVATPSATVDLVTTTGGLTGIALKPGQLTAPATLRRLGLALFNFNAFEQRTSVSVQFPQSTVTLKGSGRTGPATVTYCPGNTITPAGSGCLAPPLAPGVVRYTRTTNQFGGAARSLVQGPATWVARVGSLPPCAGPGCVGSLIPIAQPGVWGAAFGVSGFAPNPAFSPGVFSMTVSTAGLVLATGTPLGPGGANPVASFAGPWTTGRVTVSQPSAIGGGQIFIFTGSDARSAGGQGTLSLVSGGIVTSAAGGPAGTRGWLNLTVLPEPEVGPGAALGALAIAVLAWARRRAQAE